ncbi:hypothetical protein [Pelagicoccus mobilis]|nr:hypothetical protein [Pelagicoccus mobilis]
MLSYEHVAWLLLDALMVLAEVEVAGPQEATIGLIAKVAWNAE